MDILFYIVADFIFSAIGWLYLWMRYRNRDTIEQIKNEKYAGEFSAAGKVLILDFIALTGAVVASGFVVLIVIYSLYKWIYLGETGPGL